MTGIILNTLSAEDLEFDGFFDGQQKTIPDNTELNVLITGGFSGIEEGKSMQVCYINATITTHGEFCGQKYKYNAKIFDMDAVKRDRAMKNLGIIDAQAGFPMTANKLDLSTENIEEQWGGIAHARVKMGLLVSEDDEQGQGGGREINFIRGFGFLREKMLPPVQSQQPATQAQQQEADNVDF
jgi:hypothetical protein